MLLIPFDTASIPAVARFLSRLNSLPEHNICYIGLTESEISAELSVVLPPEGYGLVELDEVEQVTGFLGVELDLSLGRGWLFGPFVDRSEGQALSEGQTASDWQTQADRLYQAALQSMPPEIGDLELCSRPENTHLEEFAARHGFTRGAEAALLSLPRPEGEVSDTPAQFHKPALDSPALMAAYLPELSSLHDALFPNTYFSAAQLLTMSAEEEKRLQIEVVDGHLSGYIFLQVRPANRDANIDFLGVAEPYRRSGIASKLLREALAWAFSHPFVDQASLTVHTSNAGAIRLYERAGFKTDQILCGYRKREVVRS